MSQRIIRIVVGALCMFGLTTVVCAQVPGPPPPSGGGFGRRGPGGPGGPGGPRDGTFEVERLLGGAGGKTVQHKAFQANYSVSRMETLPGNSISNTSTGVLARGDDGSSYHDATLSRIGPLASSGKPHELIYIRNMSTMMEYMEDVPSSTVRGGAIHVPPSRNPGANGEGRGPGWGPGRGTGRGPNPGLSKNVTVSDNPSGTYVDTATGTSYPCDDKKITRTIPAGQIGNAAAIVTTTERWYSPTLDLVLQETQSDPRFGSSTYKLINIVPGTPTVSFNPDPSFKAVSGSTGKFHRAYGGAK